MAQNVLKMKYHPAKKEVKFEALQDGVPYSNYTTSTLHLQYENAIFVLQQQGNDFFNAIRELFNGAGKIHLEVTTTAVDYDDLEQMIEYYNRESGHQKSNFRFTIERKAVLPDMDDVYQKVRDYGEKAAEILEYHRADFFTIESDNKHVRESIQRFSDHVQAEINQIRSKVTRMDDNTVNLCFAGIYSAGKSSLINAILGWRILPESIEPTTARSFRIRSPKADEAVHIEFLLSNNSERVVLAWEETPGCLDFKKSLANNTTITNLTELLENCKDEPQHSQIYRALNYLNTDDSVIPVIDVIFPVPLDRENLRFTILDTPGTDSNTLQHKKVLEAALKEQESSILIFVAPANHATDGQGNQDLLQLLENSGRAIDIDRSLFVLNFADSIKPEAREILKNSKIKAKLKSKDSEGSEDGLQIDLLNKKVFFTSAAYAYLAKACRNNIATEKELKRFKNRYPEIVEDDDDGRYYQDNHCATSDCATDKIIKRSQEALKAAEGDKFQEMLVCSGLFALEDEIVRYGEKYASAVRAHAIIDDVDQALRNMSGKAKSLKAQTYASIDAIDREIAKIKAALEKAINRQRDEFYLASPQNLAPATLRELHLDPAFYQEKVLTPTTELIKKELGRFGNKVKFSEKQRDKIAEIVNRNFLEYEQDYIKQRQKKLGDIQQEFISNVRTEIQKNGDIAPGVRDFLCEIAPPKLREIKVKAVKDIYEAEKISERFLIFMNREYLNKKEFLSKLNDYLRGTLEKSCSEYKEDLRNVINSLVSDTSMAYISNLETYSILLHAKLMDKQAMEELVEKIENAAEEVKTSAEQLDQIIWEVADET